MADQVTSNLLRTVDADLSRCSRTDEDISGNGRAVGVLCGIGLGVDGSSGLRANGSSLGWRETYRQRVFMSIDYFESVHAGESFQSFAIGRDRREDWLRG